MPFFAFPQKWEGPHMGNYQVCRQELSPAVEPGTLDSIAFCRQGGGTFKDFCHFPKIAMGSVLLKVGGQVLKPITPGSHHSSTTYWRGDFAELVNSQQLSFLRVVCTNWEDGYKAFPIQWYLVVLMVQRWLSSFPEISFFSVFRCFFNSECLGKAWGFGCWPSMKKYEILVCSHGVRTKVSRRFEFCPIASLCFYMVPVYVNLDHMLLAK